MKSLAYLLLATQAVSKDQHKTFQQIALENGYSAESYTVVTSDGYVSQMYRLSGKLSELGQPVQKPAVLMMHGLLCDMNFWIANDVDLAPPFILVDEGYDVWLGNNRGNRFAQSHTTLNKSQ